jgi:hypothetical protein
MEIPSVGVRDRACDVRHEITTSGGLPDRIATGSGASRATASDVNDECTTFWYACLPHHRHYWRGRCGDGPHLIALECATHGLENMWPQPLMLMFPAGFSPPLSVQQLVEAKAAWDEDRPVTL